MIRRSAVAAYVVALYLAAAISDPATSSHAADVVIMAVEEKDNYDAVNSMRSFATQQLQPAGHRVNLVIGDRPAKHQFAGLVEALREADVLVLFSRRRFPPPPELEAIRDHLNAGRALVGIRTANHAFIPRANDEVNAEQQATWPAFTEEVLGGRNDGYETSGMPYAVALAPGAAGHSLLQGVDLSGLVGHQSLYRVLPLAQDATPLLIGTAATVKTLPQPVAWFRFYGTRRAPIFYTSLGAPEEMKLPSVRQLLLNAVNWSVQHAQTAPPQ
jgi:type 1 glutamine amidotransferase